MSRLDIYICTKSKCTAKRVQVKLRAQDTEAESYNGPGLLSAIRTFAPDEYLEPMGRAHEAACMAACPVGPRVEMRAGSQRIRYFQRQKPTGWGDLLPWASVESSEGTTAWSGVLHD